MEDVDLKAGTLMCRFVENNRVRCGELFGDKPKSFESNVVYFDDRKASTTGALVMGDRGLLFGGYAGTHIECKGYSDSAVRCELRPDKVKK